MQLSSRCNELLVIQILLANLFKERLLKCELIDLGRFVVYL